MVPSLHPIDVENYDATPDIILIVSDDDEDYDIEEYATAQQDNVENFVIDLLCRKFDLCFFSYRSVFPEKLLLPPLQSRWETSQPPPPLSVGIIVAATAKLLVLLEFVC
nr:hypothetical protein [Tanacetum cinerariifolium]